MSNINRDSFPPAIIGSMMTSPTYFVWTKEFLHMLNDVPGRDY